MAVPVLNTEENRLFQMGRQGVIGTQLRYLPSQPRGAEQFGNILGGDKTKPWQEPSAWGSSWSRGGSQAPEELCFCIFGFAEPGEAAGGGFVPTSTGTQ